MLCFQLVPQQKSINVAYNFSIEPVAMLRSMYVCKPLLLKNTCILESANLNWKKKIKDSEEASTSP